MFVWGVAPSPVSLSVMSPTCPPSSCPCARQPHPSLGPLPLFLLFSHPKPVTAECGLFGLSCVKVESLLSSLTLSRCHRERPSLPLQTPVDW